MLAQCIEAVTKAAGRKLSKAEIDGIEERMLSSMQTLARQDPAAWRSMSKEQRYVEAAKLARGRYGEDVMAAQARTIRDMQTRTNQIRLTDSVKPGLNGRTAALLQRLSFQSKYAGDISLDQKVKSVHHDFTRELDGGAMKGKFWGLVQDPNEQRTIIKAIFGEATGKPEIDAVGKQVRDVLERARVTANDAGVQIHHLDNWNLPQPWAWEKVGANREQFVKDMLAEIDPSSYVRKDGTSMTPEEIRKTVEAAAETLGTNGANKRAEAKGGYGGSVGSGRNAPRQLHFKNADSYIRMMEKYGATNNVMSLLDQHLRGMARDIATARTFGRDADRFVPQLIERAFAADAQSGLNEKQLKKLDRLKRQTLAEFQALRSPGHPGALPLWAQVSNTIRSVVGSTLLGGSTLAAIPDPGMALAYGHEIGLTKRALLGNMVEGMKPAKENLEFIRRLGITAQTMQDGTHRFGSGELSNQFTRFLNHGVHVLSVLRMLDRGQVHGVSASLMDVLGGHVSKHDFAELKPADQKYLADRGVTADHYATWRHAELDSGPNDNHTMLTPDAIYAIPDEKLRPIAEARMGPKAKPEQVDEDIRRLRSEAAQHLLAVTLSESQIGARGAAGNSTRDNVAFHVTPDNAGTIQGQFWRWLLFLKQTPLGIFRTHMIDVPGGMADWKSAWTYRARFMAYSGSLAMLSLTLKTIMLGQDPQDLLSGDGLKKVAIASGGFGMYGDFLFSDNADHSNNGLVKALGPGATFIDDAIKMYGATNDAALGEGKNYGAKTLRFARNYAMPFTRLWYAKAAFNHMVYEQQMERLNPGYNARVRARMARKNQNSWWAPGEMTPERAPNLGAAVGQPASP